MDVPYFGYLFKTTSAENPKTNILFFLTPQVFELDEIPYTEPAFKQQIERYQKELQQIDPDKQDRLIEKYQDLNQK
jgi:type II secretory pathway component GspD/PulD (secretin)